MGYNMNNSRCIVPVRMLMATDKNYNMLECIFTMTRKGLDSILPTEEHNEEGKLK